MKRWISALCCRSFHRFAEVRRRKETGDPATAPQASSDVSAAAESAGSSSNKTGIERTKMMGNSQNAQIENIILNGDFSEGLRFWHPNSCHAYVSSEEACFPDGIKPNSGRSYAVVTRRTESWQGLEQDITGRATVGIDYAISAFVRISGDHMGSSDVLATLKVEHTDSSSTSYLSLGRISGSRDCWQKLEGSFSLSSVPKLVVFYLEGPPPGVDLLISSVTICTSSPKQFEETGNPAITPQGSSSCSTAIPGVDWAGGANGAQVHMENIILNNDFSEGLQFWHPNLCHAYVASDETGFPDGVKANSGRSYAVVTRRTECWQGLEQDLTGRVTVGIDYTVSAFVRISGDHLGASEILATLKVEHTDSSPTSYLSLGRVSGSRDCWKKLEGSFSLASMPKHVIFYLEGPPPGVDLLINSVTISSSSPEQLERTEVTVNSLNVHTENIILNGDFSEGLQFWHTNSCHAYVASEETGFPYGVAANSGMSYAVVTGRTECWQGLEQDITERVVVGTTYTVSAIVRVYGDLLGSSEVQATLKVEHSDSSPTSYLYLGRISASQECWKKLEGSFSLVSIPKCAIFYLEGPSPGVDLLIDCVTIFSSVPNQFERTVVPVNSLNVHTENIILNGDFAEGLQFWHTNSCHAYVASEETGFLYGVAANSGMSYVVVTRRTECWQGLEQDITERVIVGTTYTVSAVVRVYGDLLGSSEVQATLKVEHSDSSPTSYLYLGRISGSQECWKKLEGSFSLVSIPKRAIFYLEGPSPGVDLLIDCVTIFSSVPNRFEEMKASCVIEGDENIIWNPSFEDGLNNWAGRGCQILLHNSKENGKIIPLKGKHFASTSGRSESWNGIQQDITGRVQRKIAYEVTAIVRLFGNSRTADLRATLWVQAPNGREQYIGIAKMQVSDQKWVHLNGKFLLNCDASKAAIFLEGPPAGSEILVNSLVVKRSKRSMRSSPPYTENTSFGVNIIENSHLNNGLNGWSPLGPCTLNICTGSPRFLPSTARNSLTDHVPLSGRYILATNRTESWMGPSQTITDKLQLHLTYQVVAWVRVGSGATMPQMVNLALGVDDQWVNGGQVEVINHRWHEVGGSFRIEKQPSKVLVYVQGPSPGVDLMVAGLQIFPVDRKARFKHLKEKTDKVRKRDVTLKFVGTRTDNMHDISVKVRQLQNSFPFGSCISRSNIDNEEFVNFFVKNFSWAVFENELKWYHTEPEQGKYIYKDADEMLDFCERHCIQTRGHCIFWDVADAIQPWVQSLNKDELMSAVENRLKGLLSRYKGKFAHYDVNNEMLHGSFFQDRLGNDIRAYMFREAHRIDPSPILFVNDYNVEDGCDAKSSPEMYMNQVLDLQERGAPIGGIGLQAHISHPVGAIVCSALDKLATLGLPIWFTEVDVASENEHIRADDLEVMLREAFAHPAVEGVMLWGFWELFMSRENSHLVDAEGHINEAGKRYLALKQEWLSGAEGLVDDSGEFKFRGFHGSYHVEITTPSKKESQTFTVDKGEIPLVLTIDL